MPMEVTAWLTNVGRYEDAVRYGALFWPTFAEMDGCVFLGSGVPDTFGEWRAKLGADRQRIEAVLNHRHILELFLGAPEPCRSDEATWAVALGDVDSQTVARLSRVCRDPIGWR
jgi:hypothetical protein